MSFSNEKGITIQTADELAAYVLVGINGAGDWAVCDGSSFAPLGVTTNQSNGATATGKWNTPIQLLGSGDAVKQLLLGATTTASLGQVLYSGADGTAITAGTYVVGRAMQDLDNGSGTIEAPIAVDTATAIGNGNGFDNAILNLRTLGDVLNVDGGTPGSNGTYEVPDGTSLITIDRSSLPGEVKLVPPTDAPSVILIMQTDGDIDAVKWDDADLSLCPMNLLIRAGADWMQVPLANAFEYRMKNDVFTYDGTEDTEPKTVSVPAGTGRIDCENLAQDVTLKINGVFYPQLIGIANKDNSTGNVVFNGVTVEPDEFAVIMNVGSMWIEIPFGGGE